MAKVVEKFSCNNCGGHGTIAFKEDESRFSRELVYCPFCGSDLDNDLDEDILMEDDYEE